MTRKSTDPTQSIVACGIPLDIGTPVVLWNHKGGYASPHKRGRPVTGTGTRNNALPWASDSTCVPDPAPFDPNSPVVLDSIRGVVYDHSGMALSGAHLQVVGTSYHTFSSRGGRYSLVFDVSLVANCRVQVVRVSAGGYRGRDLYLAMGLGNNNVYMDR